MNLEPSLHWENEKSPIKKNAGASTPAFFNTGGNLRRNISNPPGG